MTPKIGDASLGRPAANEMAGMTHAVIAANTQEIRFMQVPRRLTTRISIDINNRLRERLRGFLRHIVPDTIQFSVRILP